MFLAILAKLVAGQFLALLFKVVPEIEQGDEVGFLVVPLTVGLVCGLRLVLRTCPLYTSDGADK